MFLIQALTAAPKNFQSSTVDAEREPTRSTTPGMKTEAETAGRI